ncbi:MAG: SpoIIE family protein phosphatase [Candidatus Eremiobacteraeota bacterium]|nr:SpoIIE family protein phosphatase [Candidatus Eremiobacteraeota bacterium]
MAAVRRYDILDTPPDGAFDRITALAAHILGVPIALVTIVDEDRIWFKSRFGLDEVAEIDRDPGLCSSAICRDDTYIIESARTDVRSLANPLVAGEFGLQFYAAVPLRIKDGHRLGTLCVLDRQPRKISSGEIAMLELLASIVVDELEVRLGAREAVARERTQQQRTLDAVRSIAEGSPIIMWTADAKGWIDWYNSRWYEYTGQTLEEAVGWGWQAAHHPEDLPRVMQEWPYSIATGEPFEAEFRLRRFDGSFHTVLTRAVPIRNENGEIERWHGSNVDIQAQKDAHERTRQIAETMQRAFLPAALPRTRNVQFDALYIPAEKDTLIGGDWFDATQLPNGRFLVSIGDVTGHGLDASIVGGRLRQAIIDYGFATDDPAIILSKVNRILRFQSPEVYATAIVGFIEADGARFSYARAGHPPPLLARSKIAPAQTLPLGGAPALGIEEEISPITHVVELHRDDVLALYTDGLTEFSRTVDATEEKLKIAVAQLVGDTSNASPATAVANAVLGEALPPDDVAILIAQFSAVNDKTAHA